MIGRFLGTFLMKYIAPNKLLAVYSVINIILLAMAVGIGGNLSVYSLMLVEFFMSIMFPTIFSLSIKDLGAETKIGASLVIMSIVGGAVMPLIMGRISDMSSIRWSYLVPMVCFFPIFYFGMSGYKTNGR
jgi:FHS family L-fucose permease-like MFS transporter